MKKITVILCCMMFVYTASSQDYAVNLITTTKNQGSVIIPTAANLIKLCGLSEKYYLNQTPSSKRRVKYEIFATSTYDMDTGKMSPIVQNFIHAYVEDDKLVLDSSRNYRLYNKSTNTKGLSDRVKYDAIDNKNQRCTVIFETTAGESWATRNKIYITYEGSDIMYIYMSNDPKE